MAFNKGTIAVIGFGKIGQALTAHFLDHNAAVHAIDPDVELLKSLTAGTFASSEPGVADRLRPAFSHDRFTLSDQVSSVKNCDAIIICIPFSIDRDKLPDSKPFINTVCALAPWLSGNKVVIIETSLPVGFCRNSLLPALESEGVVHGRDFFLAHSPERIKSGTMMQQLAEVPKVIGGIDEEATGAAVRLYQPYFEKLEVVSSVEAAEMVKMAGMMYRDINIALANQLAMFAGKLGIDLPAITNLINSDEEAKLLQPGIGVGGHCTPVYPYLMMDSFRQAGLEFTLAEEARRVNEMMPAFASSLVDLQKDCTVLILGLAFRPGVREDAFSPAYSLAASLHEKECKVFLHDPVYTLEELKVKGFVPADDIYATGASVVFLITMHEEYRQLDFVRLYEGGVRFFVDGRNGFARDPVERAGIVYKGIGK